MNDSGLDFIVDSVVDALESNDLEDVFMLVKQIFISLAEQLIEENGYESALPIVLNGEGKRGVTIHALETYTPVSDTIH